MRKVDNSTSQDGADTTSITSTFESEGKKSSIGFKTKRSSIKRKIPNFSHDSDDTVIEPLLQSEKDKSDKNKSAKFSMSKSKSDLTSDEPNIITESHLDHISKTSSRLSENIPYINIVKDISVVNTSATAPIYNHMNTNIFGGLDTTKSIQTKSAVIVEIDNTKSSSYSPSPLIFTTAKIHSDTKAKQLEPLQITPVPILSTIEGNIIKSKPSTIGGAEKDYGYIKSKSDIQKLTNQENTDKFIKTSNFNDKESTNSMTITVTNSKAINISKENTCAITTISPVESTSKTSFDKSSKITDVNISDKMNSKVDLKLPTVAKYDKTLQDHEKPQSLAANNTKLNITEKEVADYKQFDPKNTKKLTNAEKVLSIDDNNKQTFEGITFHKPMLTLKKDSIEITKTCADSTNKEKTSKFASNVPSSRQLQRQKNATVEDITNVDIKNKSIDSGQNESSNLNTDQNITLSMCTKDSTRKEFDTNVKSVVDKPKTLAEKDNVNTLYISRTDKSSLVTEVPTKKPKTIVTSVKSFAPETKSIVSKDSKPVTFTAESGISKPKNTTSVKETIFSQDSRRAKNVSEQSAVVGSSQLSDNVGPSQSIKSSSSIKSGASSTSKPQPSNNTNLPSTATKAVNQNLGNKTPTTTGSTTNILKDSVSSSLPSTSAKTIIATNKKIEPLFSKHNKDSRA